MPSANNEIKKLHDALKFLTKQYEGIAKQVGGTNRERAVDFLNSQERLYVVDAFGGADPKHRLKVQCCTF